MSIEIVAKEKLCPVEGMPCDPITCSYAKGYFDRSRMAVKVLLNKKFIKVKDIERVSEKYVVCPFEISLDTSLWADIVVCDYNYVFDPFVRLKRFQPPQGIHLLIDEAHQLFPRVNSMFTVELDVVDLGAAINEAVPVLLDRLNAVNHEFEALVRNGAYGRYQIETPDNLNNAIVTLLEFFKDSEIELDELVGSRQFIFSCYRWAAALDWEFREIFEYIVEYRQDRLVLRRACIDSTKIIDEVLGLSLIHI